MRYHQAIRMIADWPKRCVRHCRTLYARLRPDPRVTGAWRLAAVIGLMVGYSYVAGCGDADSPADPDGSGSCPPATSTRKVVRMLGSPDFRFEPEDLTVNRGDTVIWCNESSAIHTSTSGSGCTPDGLWNSGTMGTNARFAVVFDSTGVDTVGTIPYFCAPHCKNFNMVGTVTISP